MRFATSLVLSFVVLMTSSCDLSGCTDIRQENESVYQDYLDLREKRFKEWQKELSEWEIRNTFEQAKRNNEIERCLNNPYEYYRNSKLKRLVEFFGGYERYKQEYGIEAVCETLQEINDPYSSKPLDDSAEYPPAVEKYILSMTIKKNNPKCFSATEVAEAEQELLRLNSNS